MRLVAITTVRVGMKWLPGAARRPCQGGEGGPLAPRRRLREALVRITVAAPFPWCHLNGQQLLRPKPGSRPGSQLPVRRRNYEVMPVHGGRLFRPQAPFRPAARSAAAFECAIPILLRHGRRCCNSWSMQWRRRAVRIPATFPRRGTWPQSRPLLEYRPHGVCILFAMAVQSEGTLRDGLGLHHRPGHPLGALRHQVRGVARQRAAAPACRGCGRV